MKRLGFVLLIHLFFLASYAIATNTIIENSSFNGPTRLIMVVEHLLMIVVGLILIRPLTDDKNERFMIGLVYSTIYLVSLYFILSLQLFMLQ